MSVVYQVLIVMVVTFTVVFLVFTIVNMTVHSSSYKYYKVTYNAIRNCNYIMVRNSYNQQTYHRPDETNPYTNDEIIFFLSGGEVVDIKLLTRPSDNHYIHSKGGSDLYAKYWFKKILKVRDKYNHQLWVSTRQEEIRENMLGVYIPQRSSFKFLRG